MHQVDQPTEMGFADLNRYLLALICRLAFQNALAMCIREGREYTEIHFWRDPETDQFVLTYWEINE